jgi:hypothetical protein
MRRLLTSVNGLFFEKFRALSSGLNHRYLYLICLTAFLVSAIDAQVIYISENDLHETWEHFDHSYSSDYNLLNGRLYDLPYSANTHPFLHSDQFRPGSIRLNEEDYTGISINYNIHDQQVVLQYLSNSGLTQKLILNQEFIESFQLDGKLFRKLSFPETGTRFFQVVRTGDISCYFYWVKKLHMSSSSFNTPYSYSKQTRKVYLYKEGQLHLISDRSSFATLYNQAYRKEIEQFLRREKIRFRNVSEESLSHLIDFCIRLDQDL